jgi:hypothetical protein
MGRNIFSRISILLVLATAGLLISFLIWRQTLDQNVPISKDQAIRNAIQACNHSYGLQPVEQPTAFQGELSTYGRALNNGSNSPNSGKPVWIVKMKGRWLLVGGPPPADPNHAEPVYWDECTIVIDAQSGASLSFPIE